MYAAFGLAGVLWAHVGQAQPAARPRVILDYAAPPEETTCPDRVSFASAVATRLGYDPVVAEGAPAEDAKTLSVRFRRDNKSMRVTTRLSSAGGVVESEKELVSDTGGCAELGAAAAFAVAILLDPRAMFPRPLPKPAPGPSLDSKSPATWPWYEPPPLPPPPPPAPPETPVRWHGGLAVASCIGCAPSLSLGAALFVGASKGRFGIDAGVRGDLPASTSAASGKVVSSSLVLGELFPHARLGPLRVGLLGSVGGLFGQSDGNKQVSVHAAVGPRAALDWKVASPLFLRVAIDGFVMLSRVSLRIDGAEVWSTPAFGAAASLGAGVEF